MNERLHGHRSLAVAASLEELGQLLKVRGEFKDAEKQLGESLALYTDLAGPDSTGVSSVMNELAQLMERRGDMAGAEDYYRRALAIDRAAFIAALAEAGVQASVHWRPLHLHPYYQSTFGWTPADLPAASAVWPRLVSLPLFSTMSEADIAMVIAAVRNTCAAHPGIATALAS